MLRFRNFSLFHSIDSIYNQSLYIHFLFTTLIVSLFIHLFIILSSFVIYNLWPHLSSLFFLPLCFTGSFNKESSNINRRRFLCLSLYLQWSQQPSVYERGFAFSFTKQQSRLPQCCQPRILLIVVCSASHPHSNTLSCKILIHSYLVSTSSMVFPRSQVA